ncbi:MAG: FtsX-like permease family protein [Actinobacteria bacterium]|nr:FtsX-like permease family protein [Actinomycetota bacterium]
MISVALRGLAGRKFRALLTAIAIVLGVAMISGTLVLTDTIDRAFTRIFVDSYAGTDAVVSAKSPDLSFEGESVAAPPLPEEVLDQVRKVPSVGAAVGSVFEDSAVKILDSKGEPIVKNAPTFGFGLDSSVARFNPLELEDGRWPTSDREVVIDSGTAEDEGFGVGDRVSVATLQPVRDFQLVGIAQYGGVESLGGATFVVFDIPTAQKLLDREGKLDAISVAARDATSPDELVRDLEGALSDTVKVQTGVEQAEEQSEEVGFFVTFIRYFLLTFGAIALFVGAFVIFNTLSITVAQRTRELATLRTLGASRRQVLGSVLLEALVIGALASVIGLFSGLALASGLNALFKALEIELPTTGLVFSLRTVIVALVVGIVVTMLAGLAPALRATRVPPISAVREGATLPASRFARYWPYVAALMIALAGALLGFSLFVDDIGTTERLLAIAVGVLALFVGVALMSPKLIRPLATIVGWPARRIGGAAGRLAQGNSLRNPGRTAATAAALMIGIALVTFVAVLGAGLRDSNRDAIESQIRADLILTSEDGYTEFVAGASDAAKTAAPARVVTEVREETARVAGSAQNVSGIDPDLITTGYAFDWKEGSDAVLAQLGTDGAIVAENFADDKGLLVGESFTLEAPGGKRAELTVKAIADPPPFYPLLGAVTIPKQTFDSTFERKRNRFVFVDVNGSPEAAKPAVEAAVRKYPDARVQTRSEWIDKEDREFQQFLSMLYVLLALSVIVSIFGIINTLVLSVFERTREVGMLRAVGMTRRQVRRMIRHESIITALIGAALGLPLGVFLAALITQALGQFEIQFKVPTTQLLIFAVVAIVVGIVAAILPARRAARLNVLNALQYE